MTWLYPNFNISYMKIKASTVFFVGFFVFYGVSLYSQAPLDLNWDLTRFTPDTPAGRWALLSGQIEGYRVVNPTPENYSVEVILLSARWEETETISSWRGLITFVGADFQEIFPVRVGLSRGDGVIVPGQKVLILARHTGWSNSRKAATFLGNQIRPITF